ncbi:MAG: hypothetical protein D3910_21025 [Candidatus Electrothrix sp. ATG2]|nr:hypothetical protein [Candidatus Electrothrix sp. ATG2]
MGLSALFKDLINEHGSTPILKERVAAFKDKVDDLETENSSLKEKISILEDEIQDLKSEKLRIEKEKSICQANLDNLYEKPQLDFNTKTGTWVDSEKQVHYCPSCKSKNIIVPMQEFEHGWKCNVKECDKFYENPDKPQDTTIYTTGSRRRSFEGF